MCEFVGHFLQAQQARDLSRLNEDIGYAQAKDARLRGRESEATLRRETARLQGRQRVALAAGNVDLESGTALDIIGETAALGELDILALRNNAAREAWGYETQAQLARFAGAQQEQLSRVRGVTSLLETVASFAL